VGENDDRTNNVDFIRLVLASVVILTHSFVLTKTTLREPLDDFTRGQLSFGAFAVDGFFAISGFLVTASWMRSKGAWDFLRKRILRIHPGFIVCTLVCIVLVAPIGQPEVGAYFRATRWDRVIKNALFLNQLEMPDGFRMLLGFRDPQINGSIWTIKIEFECYLLLALLGSLGLVRRPWFPLALLGVTWPMHVLLSPPLSTALPWPALLLHFGSHVRFLAYFLFGMAAFLFRARIPYDGRLAALAGAVFVVASRTPTGPLLMPPAIAYLLLYVAFHPRIQLRNVAEKRDLSYGIYLYGWPVQYLWILTLGRDIHPYVLMALSLPGAALCALASWAFVEAPCLRLKGSPRVGRLELQARAVAAPAAESAGQGSSGPVR
jgi:peptidoglycan/LPS O-acetylase OafA/YrhL